MAASSGYALTMPLRPWFVKYNIAQLIEGVKKGSFEETREYFKSVGIMSGVGLDIPMQSAKGGGKADGSFQSAFDDVFADLFGDVMRGKPTKLD